MFIKILIIFFCFPFFIYSNGGSFEIGSNRVGGNYHIIQENDIKCLKENLEIDLLINEAIVKVTYFFKNLGNKKTINFGFPINYYIPSRNTYKGTLIWANKSLTINKINKILNYKIFVNDRKIKHNMKKKSYSKNDILKIHVKASGTKSINELHPDHDLDSEPYWLIKREKLYIFNSKINFNKNEVKKIVITYSQPYFYYFVNFWFNHTDSEFYKDYKRNDIFYKVAGYKFFKYIFETGGYWRGNKIKELKVKIDYSKLPKEVNVKIFPNKFEKYSPFYLFEKKHFKPKNFKDLELSFEIKNYVLRKYKEAKKNNLNIKFRDIIYKYYKPIYRK